MAFLVGSAHAISEVRSDDVSAAISRFQAVIDAVFEQFAAGPGEDHPSDASPVTPDQYSVADRIASAFQNHLNGIDDLKNVPDDQLTPLFMATWQAMLFSTNAGRPRARETTIIEQLEALYDELDRRGRVGENLNSRMLKGYVHNRMFERAEARLDPKSFPDDWPRIIDQLDDDTGPGLWHIREQGGSLVREPAALSSDGPMVIILSTPGCQFMRRAVNELGDHPHLLDVLARNALWIAPPGPQLEITEALNWRQAQPPFDIHLAHRREDWPMLGEFRFSPTLYFLDGGEVQSALYGWPGARDNVGVLNEHLTAIGLE